MPPVALLMLAGLLATGSSVLLVANIPMFSLKFKSLRPKDCRMQYALLLTALASTASLGIGGITLAVIAYVVLSIFNRHK
jgi:CDP-diacylglycerol--serine O-phosphatidyltransferase